MQHRIKKHSEVPSYACQYSGCYSVFADEISLQNHTREKHSKVQCEVCGEYHIDEKSLRIHISVHHDSLALKLLQHHHSDPELNDLAEDAIGDDTGIEVLGSKFDLHNSLSHKFAFESENTSLQTLNRSCDIKLEVESDGSILPKIRGAKKIERSLPLPESADSIINIVSQVPMQTYSCPYKSCHKTYVREHFYRKHLKKHLDLIKKAEEKFANFDQDILSHHNVDANLHGEAETNTNGYLYDNEDIHRNQFNE